MCVHLSWKGMFVCFNRASHACPDKILQCFRIIPKSCELWPWRCGFLKSGCFLGFEFRLCRFTSWAALGRFLSLSDPQFAQLEGRHHESLGLSQRAAVGSDVFCRESAMKTWCPDQHLHLDFCSSAQLARLLSMIVSEIRGHLLPRTPRSYIDNPSYIPILT